MKALLHLGDRFGVRQEDFAQIRLMRLTHELLAKYVGTSRDIVTQHMSQLRRKGLLDYSRAGLEVDPEILKRELEVAR